MNRYHSQKLTPKNTNQTSIAAWKEVLTGSTATKFSVAVETMDSFVLLQGFPCLTSSSPQIWIHLPEQNRLPQTVIPKRKRNESCNIHVFFFKVINDVRFQMRGASIIFHSLTSYIFLVQNSIVEMDRFSSPKILRVLNLESRWILSRLDPTITVRPFPRWFLENDFPSRAPNLGNVIRPSKRVHEFSGAFLLMLVSGSVWISASPTFPSLLDKVIST